MILVQLEFHCDAPGCPAKTTIMAPLDMDGHIVEGVNAHSTNGWRLRRLYNIPGPTFGDHRFYCFCPAHNYEICRETKHEASDRKDHGGPQGRS
jgi:hypothetical protein